MIFNEELLYQVLIVAIAAEVAIVLFLQKIKELPFIKEDYYMIYISFGVNMILGVFFTLSFTNGDILKGLWVGFFSFIGANALYKLLAQLGLLKKFKDMGE